MTTVLKEGQKAPSFSLPASTGKTISLDELKGKKVVLYFYPKDNTPGCTKEACNFRDNIGALQKEGVVVLGISLDSLSSHDKFVSKYSLPFPLLSDTDAKVSNAYGSYGEKSLYGRKFMGLYRMTFLIDEAGKIARMWPKVKPDGHALEVLQAVKELKQAAA